MKPSVTIFGLVLQVTLAIAVPPTPTSLITATVNPSTPLDVGQVIAVTCRMNAYTATNEIDSVNFNISYDSNHLEFVPGSFNTGDSSGPNQQWLSKTNQNTVSDGAVLTYYNDGSWPGTVFVTMGDLGNSNPKRGTSASSGFLVSFQLRAVGPGASFITPGPAFDGSVLLDTTYRPTGVTTFGGAGMVIRNPTVVSVQATDAVAAESNDTGTFTISRTGPTNSALAVTVALF